LYKKIDFTMAQKNKIISAIDIGTTKIVAIIGSKTDSGKFEILGVGKHYSEGVRRGEVLNISKTVESIREAVRQAEEKAGMKMQDVYVGIAGGHIHSQRTSGYVQLGADEDEITAAHTKDLMDQIYNTSVEMGEEIIHVLPQSYTVDHMQGVDNPVGVAGKRLEGNFHVVIGKVSAANNIKKCVTRVGLNVKKLILEPLASSRAVLTADELEAGVAMLDIGGGTTDLAIYRDNKIVHTSVIPLGGFSVTNDIKEGCKIVCRYAERLKKEYGRVLPTKSDANKVVKIPGINRNDNLEISFVHLAGIIQARMEEIIEHVLYQIEANGLSSYLGGGIVITGGGALLKNLPQLMSHKSGLVTRIGKPRVAVTSEEVGSVSCPSLATAIGLIMEGAADQEEHDILNVNQGLFEIENEEEQEEQTEENSYVDNESRKSATIKGFGAKINEAFGRLFDVNDTSMD
jgi:cell division protein FtsA